ncbi:MAG TPA: hypothetical protein VJ837_02545 [Candidatus Paceibacterota bacterium]|nr:hypothetical protein [Candidatus Paceibacterota bacterium]
MVDKNRLLRSVIGEIDGQIRKSEVQLKNILRRANEAPGAMQSHSDTDKNLYGRQAGGQREAIEAMRRERAETELVSLERAESVAVGSLVTVKEGKSAHRYFLLPGGGGIKLRGERGEITVVTPQTPLGTALLNKRAGDTARVIERELVIVEVL